MARISAEARGAAAYRAGGTPPAPPMALSRAAAAIWRKVVTAAPADRYGPGAQELLATFCELAAEAACLRAELVKLRATGKRTGARDVHRLLLANARTTGGVATKLRLTVSSGVKWGAGENDERQAPEVHDRLLGGPALAGVRGSR